MRSNKIKIGINSSNDVNNNNNNLTSNVGGCGGGGRPRRRPRMFKRTESWPRRHSANTRSGRPSADSWPRVCTRKKLRPDGRRADGGVGVDGGGDVTADDQPDPGTSVV